MNKVVYVLGAGFSRPLGLPVMSNFLDMGRDLYYSDTKKYKHFSHVLNSIRERLAFISWYYKTNLDNIEEILSILEMEHRAGKIKETTVEEYKKFIIDVIEYYTPPVIPPPLTPNDKGEYLSEKADQYLRDLFVNDNQYRYCKFVLTLFNADIEIEKTKALTRLNCNEMKEYENEYSIITLNYDLVLESYAKLISDISRGKQLRFSRVPFEDQISPRLVKLHGSIDDKKIVILPTWNKTINTDVEKEWECAYQLLGNANEIRIIGYSLPDTDAYVKYLLKASLLQNGNLKKIDVLCRDDDNMVKNKYDEFIKLAPPKYRFRNCQVEEYLDETANKVSGSNFEQCHYAFMEPKKSLVI